MEFRLLGPLEALENDRLLALGGGQQRALFAVLLLHANQVVSTDRLIDALWGQAPSATAAKSIQVYVSRLRKTLGEGRVVTQTPGYRLQVEPSELDLDLFEQLVGEARMADPEGAAQKLRRALALWRGPALGDLAYEPFVQTEIARLEELRWAALEQRIDADLATGRHAELVGELKALIAEHPLRERLRSQLMLALYRSARQAEALEAYRAARHELSEELGLEPSEELKRLQQASSPKIRPSTLPKAQANRRARRACQRPTDRCWRCPGRSTASKRCCLLHCRWRRRIPRASYRRHRGGERGARERHRSTGRAPRGASGRWSRRSDRGFLVSCAGARHRSTGLAGERRPAARRRV